MDTIAAMKRFTLSLVLPLNRYGLCAGFPSPADDYLEEKINLDRHLCPNAPASFLWRANGHSMEDAGIYEGDLLIIDRSLKPVHGDVVVAIVNGETHLKRLHSKNGWLTLHSENKAFPPYEIPEHAEVEIWGVLRCNVHWHGGRKP